MSFLKLRQAVNVTVTQKQYVTFHGSKMYPQTKSGIPILHNIQKCYGHDFSNIEARGQGHRALENMDTTFLKLKPDVKVPEP